MADSAFAARVLAWQRKHGRKDLPWQKRNSAYVVWISEIMLQQTRVETVIPYFERFLERFPTVADLAAAELDQVLHQWSGLGYYARARNLHKTAQTVAYKCNGQFPDDLDALVALPGIGRSTAGAILSLGMGKRATILDGNVRRFLARHAGVEGWWGETAVQKQLWALAGERTPRRSVALYNQAMMDLGAMLCTRSNPRCDDCPVAADCIALTTGRTAELPIPRPRRNLPVREVQVAVITSATGELLLERRPPSGIWGGLWSFPEITGDLHSSIAREIELEPGWLEVGREEATYRHTFSHFHLDIAPVHVQLTRAPTGVGEPDRWCWYDPANPAELGIAAPVARVIANLRGR